MFGSGWSGQYQGRRGVYFPDPSSFRIAYAPPAPQAGGPHDFYRQHQMPPPPPPLIPNNSFSNLVPCGPPAKKKLKRWGYMSAKPGRSTAVFFDEVARPDTEPPSINEAAWEEICDRVKNALTEEMKTNFTEMEQITREKRVLTDEPIKLPFNWNPIIHLDLSAATFPPKKDGAMGVCAADEGRSAVEGGYHRQNHYDSRYSRKLVRRHNDGSATSGGVMSAVATTSNRIWVKPAEEENVVSIEPPEPAEEVRDVEVTIEQPSSQSSSEVSPPDSPGRVRVECAEEEEMDEATVVRSPASIKSPVRNVIGPSYSTRGSRGSMSLRIINGHRIAGNSRECFANLNKNCQAGIFCRFEHGGSRAHSEGSVCVRLLRGLCRPDNGDCSASHSALLPHQFPRCAFFIRGDCSVDNCQLLHVRHSPNLPPCKDFVAGACTKGDACEFPHHYPYDIVKQKGCYATETPEPTAAEQQEPSVLSWVE